MKKRRFQSQSPAPTPAGHTPKSAASPAAPTASASASRPAQVSGAEPIARRAALPAMLLGLLAAFLFWADIHIMGQGGELDARVYYPFNSVKEIDGMHIRVPRDPRLEQGEPLFNRACAGCHQTDGSGGVAQNCPPVAGSDWVNVKDPSRLIRLVLKGATGPIEVNKKVWSGGTMTPFEEAFTSDEIAAILSHVRNAWGNKAPLVSAAEVDKVKAEIKDKRGTFSPDELLQVPLK